MMDEDTPPDGKYLGTISADFAVVADTLKEASYELRRRNISAHPIFPLCKEPQPVGSLLLDKGEVNLRWHVFLSFLEEFTQRGLVDEERTDEFKQIYKDADEFCCLFVIDAEFTNFVFLPYPEE
ncbi:MAG: hypothetical protein WBA12_11940 [Catalinimonas sp.]